MEPSILSPKEEDNCEDVKITDNDLPLCFNQDSHLEPIQGTDYVTKFWRNKERVRGIFRKKHPKSRAWVH